MAKTLDEIYDSLVANSDSADFYDIFNVLKNYAVISDQENRNINSVSVKPLPNKPGLQAEEMKKRFVDLVTSDEKGMEAVINNRMVLILKLFQKLKPYLSLITETLNKAVNNGAKITTLESYFEEGKANRAIADGNGNEIVSTYATLDALSRLEKRVETLESYFIGDTCKKALTDENGNNLKDTYETKNNADEIRDAISKLNSYFDSTGIANKARADSNGKVINEEYVNNEEYATHKTEFEAFRNSVNKLLQVDDDTLDELQEVINFIKKNRDYILTNTVKYSEVVDNLNTESAKYPLSASQGVKLKQELNELKETIGYVNTLLDDINGEVI